MGTRILRGDQYGLVQSEETVSESILLDLARDVSDLRIATLTKRREAHVGADWEWWIEGSHGWFAMLVQAKKLRGNEYDIGYRPSATSANPSPARQIDKLIDSASALGVIPVYALYNRRPATSESLYDRSCWQDHIMPPAFSSITAIDAREARGMLDKSGAPRRAISLQSMSKKAIPWSCLASCPLSCRSGAGPYPGGDPRPKPAGPRDPAASETGAVVMPSSSTFVDFNASEIRRSNPAEPLEEFLQRDRIPDLAIDPAEAIARVFDRQRSGEVRDHIENGGFNLQFEVPWYVLSAFGNTSQKREAEAAPGPPRHLIVQPIDLLGAGERLETPAYVYDLTVVAARFAALRQALPENGDQNRASAATAAALRSAASY